jgi:uncharacterized membrane protein YgdD (TMEM256/DUF423 family)
MTLLHGALQAFLAVALGAFGAHALPKYFPEADVKIWQTASSYHMYHALALVLLALLERQVSQTLGLVHACFGVGIFLFAGSLYALCLTQVKILGAITPLGGTAFLIGWLGLAWFAWKSL